MDTSAGERVEYVVVGLRGALVHFRAVEDASRTDRTVATGLGESLGVEPAELPGCRFTCWETRTAYGVIQSRFRLS
ncbi:hypothetical protein [Streptomyces bauhiniae]|uniref:hypothetical protein n=1 Tax=Streptomyces bauhiniae TaxID=2340725 RepID=UPI00345613D9